MLKKRGYSNFQKYDSFRYLMLVLVLIISLYFLGGRWGITGYDIVILGDSGNTYYVDATSGDDGADGLSEGNAWTSIAIVNNHTFNPGDSILFKRGETWREQLTVPSSGNSSDQITFGAYGDGDKPIISGADNITGWVNLSSGLDFDKCQNIIISSAVSSTLSDFPVYINVTYDSDMLSDFSDLRFYNAECLDTGNELDYEIENYTESHADVWVKLPSLTSSGITISMYYKNNTAVSSGENPIGVWDKNYVMVQHLEESCASGNCTIDSTQYANNGTPYSSTTITNLYNDSGKVDGAYEFDGDDDYINVGDVSSLDFTTEDFSIAFWMKTKTFSSDQGLIGKYSWSADKGWLVWIDDGFEEIIFTLNQNEATANVRLGAGYYGSLDTWMHVVAVKEGTQPLKLYLDGAERTYRIQDNGVTVNSPAGIDAVIGQRTDADYPFNGTIDEVRISNTSRSADWINQSYTIVQYQTNYVSFGAEINHTNIWNTSVTTEPPQVFFNETRGTGVVLHDLNSTNEWNWSDSILYVYSTSDPDTAYTNPGVEASARDYSINSGASYINYYNLTLEKANLNGFITYNANQEFTDVTSQYNSGNGFLARAGNLTFTESEAYNNIDFGIISDFNSVSNTLINFTATYNGKTGIFFNNCTNIIITGGSASYNGKTTQEGNGIGLQRGCDGVVVTNFESHHNWGNGIVTIYNCKNINITGGEYHHNANGPDPASGVRLDTNTSDAIVMYVKSYGSESAGLVIEVGSFNNTIKYNLFHSNARGMTHSNDPGSGNKYYNNVLYNNSDKGMGIYCYSGSCTSADVKNNIFYNNSIGIGFNTLGAAGSHDIDYNIYYDNSLSAVEYDDTNYTEEEIENGTYYNDRGYEQNGIGQDPLFYDAPNSNFILNSTSPAIDAGTDVSLTQDYRGYFVPQGSAPDIGAYEYLNVTKSNFDGDTTNLIEIDTSNITNLIIEETSAGKINFTDDVNLSGGGDLNTYVNISQNRIEIDSTNLPALDKAARLTLYNLTYSNPEILKDGTVCSSTICTEVSYNSNTGTFVFTVTGFSIYTTQETPNRTVSPGPTTATTKMALGQQTPEFYINIQAGETKLIGIADFGYITFNGNKYSVDVKSIIGNVVEIKIGSELIKLKPNEVVYLDLNNNNILDLRIKLESIIEDKAELYFKEVTSETISREDVKEVEEEVTEYTIPKLISKSYLNNLLSKFNLITSNTIKEIKEKEKTPYLIIATISVIIILAVFLRKRNKNE